MDSTPPHNTAKDAIVAGAIVLGAALLGALIGTGVGAALGQFVPGYYRSVFSSGRDPEFDPVAVGIGQGLTQGIVFGGIAGLVLAALFYRHRSRLTTTAQVTGDAEGATNPGPPEARRTPRRFRWFMLIIALCPIVGAVPSCCIGCIFGHLQSDNIRQDRDIARVNQIIAANPDRFDSLRINRGPADKFHLEGSVRNQEDADHLRDELVRAFGEERGEYIFAVEVVGGSDDD